MYHTQLKPVATAVFAVALAAISQEVSTTPATAGPPAIVVPTDYPTIQAAIDAARPGRTVEVLQGRMPSSSSSTRT